MSRRVLRPLAWLVLQGLLLALGFGSLLANLVSLVLHPFLDRARGKRVGRALIARLYRVFWWMARATGLLRMDASALDLLADEPGGLVVVANHPSLLDALMLVARLPRSFCVMKASLASNPFLGAGARLARYVRNDSVHGMVRLAVDDLRDGGQLVLFPEGTRTTERPLNPFKPGFALIAQRAGVPVQAVVIETDSPYLGKGWPLWKLPPLPIRFRARLGRRFEPGADAHALADEVERYFAAQFGAGALPGGSVWTAVPPPPPPASATTASPRREDVGPTSAGTSAERPAPSCAPGVLDADPPPACASSGWPLPARSAARPAASAARVQRPSAQDARPAATDRRRAA